MGKQGIYKFNVDCGRQGELDGVFVATDEDIEILVDNGIEVYFGEVLGKHSEVYGKIEYDEVEFVTDDKKVVDLFIEHGLSTGYSPFDYSFINFDFEEHGLEEFEDTVEEVSELIELIKKHKKK